MIFYSGLEKNLVLMLISLAALLYSNDTRAQCSAPSFVAHEADSATCASNGRVAVASFADGEGDYLEYSLYNEANTLEVRPWQTDTLFSDLAAATYTLRVRYVCGTGFSSTYTKEIVVEGNYSGPSFTSVVVQRRSQCDNGRISANASGGTLPRRFALVSSLTAAEPIMPEDYVRGPQSSGIFDSLTPGAYYVRVYDSCGSYATSSITVDAFVQVNPITSLWFSYWMCDSLSARLNLNNLGDYVSGTNDTLRALWIVYPDGSTDTLARPNVAGSIQRYFDVLLNKLGTVGDGHFPDNIDGDWPKSFQVGFRDGCGNVFTYDRNLEKPTFTATFVRNTASATGNTCDSGAYQFSVSSSPSSASGGLFQVNFNQNATYSIDGGESWHDITTNNNQSQIIPMPLGSPYDACLAFCDDTICMSGTIPPLAPLAVRAYENERYSCFGKAGMDFRSTSGVTPISIEMVSGPEGQEWVTDTLYSNLAYYQPASGRNMEPGDYIFRFMDACGRSVLDTITTLHPYEPFDFDYHFPCGSTQMNITFSKDTFWNRTSPYYISAFSGGFKCQIYNADSSPASGTIYSSSFSTRRITIPGSAISALDDNEYFIRVWKDGADSCAFLDKEWTKSATLINLNNSLTVSGCPGSPTTGTVIADAQGGNGTYTYSLYEGSVAAENLVAGPQDSNIFNGLDESVTYVVTVSDSCGRGTEATMSFGSAPPPVYNNAGGNMPCPGDTLQLYVDEMPEVAYQWYKNDELLPDTTNILLIKDIDEADSGVYKVEIIAGSCNIFLSSFELNPSECGTPLRVGLERFTAKESKGTAMLNWYTAYEQNNGGFDIERSPDSRSWEHIGIVRSKAAGGNARMRLAYDFIDKTPLPPVSFYRLRQFDIDGSYEYSTIIAVRFKDEAISVSPNPTSGITNMTGLKGTEQIAVWDVNGKCLLQENAKDTNHQLDLSLLSPGFYFIVVTYGNETRLICKIVRK